MKVSYNWLKELVNIKKGPKELTDEMSLHSIEIENIEKLVNATGLVVGHVLSKEKHPNADKLSVCSVDLGSSVAQIVCGAPNVDINQKVIVALPGAKLPFGEIKLSTIRGVPSNGMLCSLQELGIEAKYIKEEFRNGIYILGDDAKPGVNALEYLYLDDYVIELGITPNRMDLLSMLGVAKDVNAMYNLGLIEPSYDFTEDGPKTSDEIDVELLTSTCYSYYAKVIKNVTIKESPQFIKSRLIASGIRPINNVVDITNYVLMLFGQPLHAFDQNMLGNKITVRRATSKERLVTLDNVERSLNRSDLVITDNYEGESRIVCLAGVMGGLNTEVTSETKNLVLESAVFRPLNIRRTSSRLNLRSESSVRFERGVDLNNSLNALNYACYLLKEYADATICKGYVHKGTNFVPDKEFIIDADYVNNILGLYLSNEEIIEIFNRLGFSAKLVDNSIVVLVQNRRLDITIKEDLVEEIVRIYGYDKLEETLPKMNIFGSLTKEQKLRRNLRHLLKNLGLNEVITYSLVNSEEAKQFDLLSRENEEVIKILHPLSEERTTLRRSLIPSLVDVLRYNVVRKNSNVRIFELGKRYYSVNNETHEGWLLSGVLSGQAATNLWKTSFTNIDFYYTLGVLENIFRELNLEVKIISCGDCLELHPKRTAEIIFNNKRIGFIGELHPEYSHQNGIDNTYCFELLLDDILLRDKVITLYQPISKIIPIERDLAFVIDNEQEVQQIVQAIKKCDKQTISDVIIFDEYKGENLPENKRSVAFKIKLESECSLTEEQINKKIEKVIKSIQYQFDAVLRK